MLFQKLSYRELKESPLVFLMVTGVEITLFETILERITPLFEEREQVKKQKSGHPYALCLEDQLLAVLVYYRTYLTHRFLGYLLGVDETTSIRTIRRIEPLLAKRITIKKDRSLTPERVLQLLVDATEQRKERPKKKQKKSYSGKKKCHTLKTEIRTELSGKIVYVSRAYHGKTHDLALHKQETPLPKETEAIADKGYQGLQKAHTATLLPIKKKPKQELTKEQKSWNRYLASIRIVIEHTIGKLKIFRILQDRYRNRGRRYHLRFAVIAGITNMRFFS